MNWIHNFLQDLGFGFRVLIKQPVSLVSALAALTLGIGLTTFMFCVINGILLRRIPLPESDRLVSSTVPAWAFPEFSRQQTVFEGLVSFGDFHANFRATGTPSRREVCFITANFLQVLRAKPELGRDFLPDEDAPGAAPVALLSHKLWQEEFEGSPAVLGSTIRVDGQPKTVIGVMGPDFRFPINDDLWVAAGVTQELANRETGFVFGRLKPAAGLALARAELNTIWTRLMPPRRSDEPALEPIRAGAYADALTGVLQGRPDVELGMLAMVLVTSFVLFLACANVAMLTLGRAMKRSTEFAVRSALGATRRRVVLQLLAENLILSAGGALGGTLAAGYIQNWLISQTPSDTTNLRNFASWWRFEINGHVLLFVAGVTFATIVLAGLWPALQATKRDVNELLKSRVPGSSGLGLAGFQRLLVISQVTISVVILVGSFALVGHRLQLNEAHLTFDPKAMLTADVELSASDNPVRFFEELDRNLAQAPGIEAVALASEGFEFGHGQTSLEIEGRNSPRPEDLPQVGRRVVTPDYFRSINLPLLQGRGFETEDRSGTLPVAVVNATFAQKFLPSGDPLGSRFREGTNGPWMTVVGCVPDALIYGNGRREPVCYLPMSQHPRQSMKVLLRGRGKSSFAWTKIVRAEVARLQSEVPVSGVATVQQSLDGVDGGWMDSLLLTACGAASLFLATVGIFGMITLSVSQRTREIGIRLALGATKGGVTRTILKQALWQIGAGLVAGLLLALALVRSLGSIIPSTATEPWVYLGVMALMGCVGMIAVLIPAMRGAGAEPMVALRHE